MNTFHKAMIALLMGFAATTLNGCGCDEDKGGACGSNLKCDSLSKCLKDADCCDLEKNGVKMKDSVAALCQVSQVTTSVRNSSLNHRQGRDEWWQRLALPFAFWRCCHPFDIVNRLSLPLLSLSGVAAELTLASRLYVMLLTPF